MSKRSRDDGGAKAKRSKKKVSKLDRAVASQRSAAASYPQQGLPAVRGMVHHGYRAENRSADILNNVANFSTAGSWVLCNGVVQGASPYERVSQVIVMKSIHVCGMVRPTQTNAAATNYETGRMMLIYDRYPGGGAGLTGAQPTIPTVLLDQATTGGTGTTSNSGLNMIAKDRFKVLRDWKFLLPPLGINGVASAFGPVNTYPPSSYQFQVNEYIKLGDLESHFNAATAGIGAFTSGAIWLFCFVDAGDPAWAFESSIRLRFSLE